MPEQKDEKISDQKNWKRHWKILVVLMLGVVFLGFLAGVFLWKPAAEEINYSQFKVEAEAENIEIPVLIQTIDQEVKIVTGKFKDSGKQFIVYTNENVYKFLDDQGLPWKPKVSSNSWSIVGSVLPLFFLGLIAILIYRVIKARGNQILSFGKTKGINTKVPDISFDDVGGAEEAKEEVQEVVEFLKKPEKFSALGARVPRGVLLVGPPGNGKTLIARAVAGEANVPFFSISGSEFVEMFVGVGASRVRDLFDQAKRNAPCIVFVDEIDAVGRHRGAGLGQSHNEGEQTLNQICTEMDGFDKDTNVIVLAATNRPDILDPALLRPGRFDRQVVIDLPSIKGRKEILDIHAKGKPFVREVNLEEIAKETIGFSGADLANLLNEAAILAGRRNLKTIGKAELEESIDRVIAGPQRKSKIFSEKEKEIVARHEVGHALVGRVLPRVDPVDKISIIARGRMGGFTRFLPEEDRYIWTRSQFQEMLAAMLGGIVAEELLYGEPSTGVENDLEQVREVAWKMVTRYGMGEDLPPQAFGKIQELIFLGKEVSEQRDYGPETAVKLDIARTKIVQKAHDTARAILEKYRDELVTIAQVLSEEEVLEGEVLEAYFKSVPKNRDIERE